MAGLKLEQRFIKKRILRLVYIAAVTMVCGPFFCLIHLLDFENAVMLFWADLLFGLLLVFYLESDRLYHKDPSIGSVTADSSEYFQRFAVCYTIAIIYTGAVSFLPEYTSPILLLAFLLTAALSREQALLVSVFLTGQLVVVRQDSSVVLVSYLFLALCGTVLVEFYRKWDHRQYGRLLAALVNFTIPLLFYYIDRGRPGIWTVAFVAAGSLVTELGIRFFYDKLHFRQTRSDEISLDMIVDQKYYLVREMQKYSTADYKHALRTSRISAHAAACIGAKVKVAAVGGFYYRLGKLEGEPFIENGIRMAEENCFPRDVITIISEYKGEKYPISTIESAIVHITDTLVTKFELLDQDTLSSSWNRDMVIYQTLNEKSSSGIYDDSGLTMNQFIKIREFLAKEETLL